MNGDKKDVMVHISAFSVFKVILVLLLAWTAFILRDLILVIITAVVIASSIEPIIKWIVRRRLPRLPAVIMVYVGLGLILFSSFYFLVLPLANETSSFLSSVPNYINSVKSWSFSQNISIRDIVGQANELTSSLSQGFWNFVPVVFGGFLSFILIVALSFYLSVQENGVGNFILSVTPLKHKKYMLNLWTRAENKIGLWLQGQLVLALIVAVLVYLGLTLFGFKEALLLAVLAGTFELIPLFGPALAAIPAVAIGFLDHGLTFSLLVVGFYIIIQQFESQLIYPLVVKKVVGVPPIISIVALVAGYTLAGFLGLILSVPLAAVFLELVHDVQKGVFSKND